MMRKYKVKLFDAFKHVIGYKTKPELKWECETFEDMYEVIDDE